MAIELLFKAASGFAVSLVGGGILQLRKRSLLSKAYRTAAAATINHCENQGYSAGSEVWEAVSTLLRTEAKAKQIATWYARRSIDPKDFQDMVGKNHAVGLEIQYFISQLNLEKSSLLPLDLSILAEILSSHFARVSSLIEETENNILEGIRKGQTTGAIALHQIPPAPADFTGRKEDVEEILEAVRDYGAKIVGVEGMGGIGKTALSLVLAERFKDDYPDAQLILSLRGTGPSPMPVIEAMANVIRGFRPTATLPDDESQIKAIYYSVLEGKSGILVLDNAIGKEQVEPLIPPSSWLSIITSRQHFVLPGIFVTDLDQLPSEDAEEFLLKIAPRVKEAGKELAELCGKLPQALRIAGSALAVHTDMSPEEYIGRLKVTKTRYGALSDVYASIRLSYDLLRPELQRVFCALGVFPASFDQSGAASVWEMELDIAQDILRELRTFSLVEWNHTLNRYNLHDLVRDFTFLMLEDTDKEAAQLAHSTFYLEILARSQSIFDSGGTRTLDGLRIFDVERENIEAGYEWAHKHSGQVYVATNLCMKYGYSGRSVLAFRHPPQRRLRCLEGSLDAARALRDNGAEEVLLGLMGSAYFDQGDFPNAIEHHTQSLGIARRRGDRFGEATTLGNLGNVYYGQGDYAKAIESHEGSLAISKEVEDRLGQGQAYGNLGNVYLSQGNYTKGIECQQQSLSIALELGNRVGQYNAIGNLGNIFLAKGEYDRALECHRERLTISLELADRLGEATALGNLGNVYYRQGDYAKAIESHERSLAISKEIEDRAGQGRAYGNLGNVYCSRGVYSKAEQKYKRSLCIADEIGNRGSQGVQLGNLGNVYFSRGDYAKAIEYYERSLAIAEEIRDRPEEGRACGNLGNAYYNQRDYPKAITYYERSQTIAKEMGDRAEVNSILGRLGHCFGRFGVYYGELGLYHEAIEQFEKSINAARLSGDRLLEGHSEGDLGTAYSAIGEYLTSKEHHQRSLAIAREMGDQLGEAHALLNSSQTYYQTGEVADAIRLAEEALAIYEGLDDANAANARFLLSNWQGEQGSL